MKVAQSQSWILAGWISAVIVVGGILTSYHQPFKSPSGNILNLVQGYTGSEWRVVHVLSGSCGCSQKVMLHLLNRHRASGFSEQILMVDGEEAYLPDSPGLLKRLAKSGFPVTHIDAKDIPVGTGLRGVPLLLVASSENRVLYLGGYGNRTDDDVNVFSQILYGKIPGPLPVFGCAVGKKLRRASDPFHLKY